MAEAKCEREFAKSMSLDEFKQEMFRSLRDTGTIEMIRAQLRRKFIEKLQQHGMKERFASLDTGEEKHPPGGSNNEVFPETICGGDVDTKMIAANTSRMQWGGDEKLVNGLLFDYFAKKALEHSAAVFVPEIGGAKNYIAVDTILQDSQTLSKQTPLIVLLLQELSKHLSTHTMDSGTQTALDCHDHRFALENQLRRVETAYLTECENQKSVPNKTLENRMLQYQSEYDALSEKRMQEELERFKTMELALMRVEERKKYEREADTLRASLLQEQRQKSERLQEKERDLELAFVAKRTELETSLFETRQSLFQEMEKLRVKEATLQVKVERDFRNFAAESKRLQLWEENVRTQEENMERLVVQAIREKEHELQLERSQVNHALKIREDELTEREAVVECEKEAVKAEKLKHKALMDDLARMEESLQSMEQALKNANKTVGKLEKENKRLQDDLEAKEVSAEHEKGSLSHLSASNARLTAEKELVQQEVERYRAQVSEHEILVKQLTLELRDSQQQLLAIKMDEANALVSERKRFMKALDDDREQFQWKENELLTKLRELQGRLAESEAAVEKFHSQYEDEKLHVESLRQEVGNLNALLSQAQATINAKHGTVALHRLSRAAATGGGGSMEMGAGGSGSGDFGSDRLMMMKLMEMMARLQYGPQFMQQYPQPVTAQQQPVVGHQPSIPASYPSAYASQTPLVPDATITKEPQAVENDEEDKKLREEQLRIERELLEQREYERKKAERMAQEENEIAERKRLFDEEFARQRQARLEEDERLESERRRKLADEEHKMQNELEKHRRALQETSEQQQRLAEERSTASKQRMQDEHAYQERMRAENVRLEQELEAKRLKKLQEDEEEAEAEKRRKEQAKARSLQQQQEEEELEKRQEKLKQKLEREREEAKAAAVEAARREEAEEEQRRRRELEMLEKQTLEEEKEREQAERATADSCLREEQEERKFDDGDYAQDTHDQAAPILGTDLLKTIEPDIHEVVPVVDIVSELSQSAQSEEMGESEPTTAAEASREVVTSLESTANEATDELKDEHEDSVTTTNTPAAAEEEPKELTEEEQRRAEEEEKKKQADAAMDVYRQRVIARKAAEKQKQLEMEAAEAERRRQEEQANEDSEQEEMELSGGSFAESSAGSGSDSF